MGGVYSSHLTTLISMYTYNVNLYVPALYADGDSICISTIYVRGYNVNTARMYCVVMCLTLYSVHSTVYIYIFSLYIYLVETCLVNLYLVYIVYIRLYIYIYISGKLFR